MPPDRTLKEIVAEARLEKASRRYGRAAVLFAEAAHTPEAKADAETRRSLLRQEAACTYLDDETPKATRVPKAIALLVEPGTALQVAARIELAMALKGETAFGQARVLLAEARELIKQTGNPDLEHLELKARQQHALCTYKDVDLPPGERFDEALSILGVEDLKTTVVPETLGIAGAVHKAMWKLDAQRAHLERALHYYERGCRAGVAAADGYPAINAAYILDLLASLEEDDLGPDDPSIAERRSRAREIREQILATVPPVAAEETKKQWWYAATLAEAEFGLGQFDQAAKRLKAAREASPVEDWEFEATARQLASLLHLLPEDGPSSDEARKAFTQAFGVDPKAAAILLAGKFGLALSGGGFRASLFHIGVLARLAELDVLRHIEVLSCVSGGSIIGAYYYLEVRKLFKEKAPKDIIRQDYLDIVERIAREFLAGVQTNVRMRMAGSLLENLQMIWRNLSLTERTGELFKENLYSRIDDDKVRVLKDLTITPRDWNEESSGPFQPKYHNWRLEAKVPILILNATTLNTGHNWQFTTSFMGESPLAVDPEVDGNNRLRRLYYNAAPTEELKQFQLGRAVAASACVPVLFEPIALSGLYPGKTVRLADGGVHDNQGIVGLLEQDCTVMLVSDASGHVGIENDPKSSSLGVAGRSNDLLMARVRGAQYRDLKSRLRSRVVRGLMFLHLRKDLDVDPVDWARCNDPSTPPPRQISTSYEIRKDVQEKLAAIRTDLDSFGEAEAFALMTSGYCMTNQVFPECVGKLVKTNSNQESWEFLQIRGLLTDPGTGSQADRDDLSRVLDVGRHQFFKYFYLHPKLMTAARVARWLAPASALIALIYVLWDHPSYQSIIAGAVAGGMVLALICLGVLSWLTKQPFLKLAQNIGIAVVGSPAAFVHLRFFDPRYLRRSTDYRKSIKPLTGPAPTARVSK
ncbi:MAG: patatin-like phospholipase family protein [Paludisphaera borealis]|uniref:patatin-like phospholipase family protein n=1 Tax=Paludisphaera borealis TaxID=1387353 RepID=UPI00284F37F6|nr:patatin-like phospholipase family protein [Paludisphaera borealis]MDR3619647.1 patatin-like phospholipase family protein [Paludisphaera borealis]